MSEIFKKLASTSNFMSEIFKNILTYEWTCKRRNHHEPNLKDEDEFKKNTELIKITYCQDCKIELQLKINDEDPEKYWVEEY